MTSIMGSVLYIAFIGAIFYFLMIKPQQKMQKKRVEMLDNVSVGEKISSISGLIGTIVAVNRETIMLEIADGVVIEMKKTGIAGIEGDKAETVDEDDDDDDLYDDLYDDEDDE